MTYLNSLKWQSSPTIYPLVLRVNEIHLWYFNFATTDKTETYWHFLSTDEKERANRFYFEKDRKAYLFSRGVLRSILSQYTGIKPATISLKYTPYEKPFLDPLQNTDHLHFNVSHTHHCILYAFTKNIEIGIDVEYLKDDIDFQGIAKNFFSHYEYQTLTKAHQEQQCALFYKIWTCKEAFIKAIGMGLFYSLADFDVCVQENQSPQILNIQNIPQKTKQWTLCSLIPTDGYIAAVATRQQIKRITYYSYRCDHARYVL